MSDASQAGGQPGLAASNLASTIRIVVAVAGGIAIGKGWLTKDQVTEIGGALVVLIPLAWAFIRNHNTRVAYKAAVAAPAGLAK